MIKAILWDIDGTLLNFLEAEKAALKALFVRFGLGEITNEMIARYSTINHRYWKMLERGEMDKPDILVGRFVEFFREEGIPEELAAPFNDAYQLALGDTVAFCDESDQLVKDLKDKIPQYAVTNGTLTAQTKKLKASGLDQILQAAFISDVIGYEKPDPRFFVPVWETLQQDIPGIQKDEVLLVGDSLTSDILGGMNAGFVTCWYHPPVPAAATDQVNDGRYRVDYEIQNLQEVLNVLS